VEESKQDAGNEPRAESGVSAEGDSLRAAVVEGLHQESRLTAPAGEPESTEAAEPIPARRRTWLLWAAGATAVVVLAGAGLWAWTRGPLKGYRAVASVNGTRITRSELDAHMAFLIKTGRLPAKMAADEAAQAALDRAILDDLINRRLLMAEVDRRQIKLDPKEEEALAGKPLPPGPHAKAPESPAPGKAEAPEAAPDPAIRDEVRRQLLVGRLVEQVTEGIAVSDDEVAKYYGDNKQSFFMPGAAKLRILVVDTQAEAEHLHKQIAGGADFAALVRDHSKGPAKEAGGDLGWVDVRMLPPALGQAVTAIPKAGLAPVVAGGDKFYVLRVEGRQGERQVPLAEVKDQLKPALLMERKRAKFSEMLAELRKNAKIEIYI
jgi:foldase protein PrsA